MFDLKDEYLDEEASQDWITKPGCYEFEITEAKVVNSTSSKAQALELKLESDNGNAKLKLFHKDKDGLGVKFVERHIAHLVFLLQIQKDKVKPEHREGTGKMYFSCFENKRIGAVLEVKKNDKGFTEYVLKSFYGVNTKKTAKEIRDKVEQPLFYNECMEKYTKKNTDENFVNGEEFPF
ncbi:MAG: hypothetical protein HUJ87_14855 [Fusobacterium varium]|uniref:hypothetical protein n=1 Tax=Fusobacterium varium TaxID=856 RepID=UPI00242E81F9|nr:hypothetical protein [Fusobacterium varium]MCF0171771.1 hypothetical protein [Fusobacterium varium]